MALEFSLTPVLSNPMQPIMPLLFDAGSGECACVDPADAELALSAAAKQGWTISKIFVTHHHNDHTAGVLDLKAATGAEVWGPLKEDIAGVDHKVGNGDWVTVGGSRAMVYECPGHTSGHIVFHFLEDSLLVAGDTLFVLGCGRLNEGTPAEMWGYLSDLRHLPDETRVLCGHDYTAGNLAFTRSITGGSAALDAFEAEIVTRGRSIPSLIAQEKALNIFLAADDPKIAAAVGLDASDPVAVFAELRNRKDRF